MLAQGISFAVSEILLSLLAVGGNGLKTGDRERIAPSDVRINC